MPSKHPPTPRHLKEKAARYAKFYFDPVERARILTELGHSSTALYVVLAVNNFTPLPALPGCAAMLRRFVRGMKLNQMETQLLDEYWHYVGSAHGHLLEMLGAGQPIAAVKSAGSRMETWPAVGLAESEQELSSLLVQQFERIRQNRINWVGVDSNTYYHLVPGGACVEVIWFWHGH